LAQLATTIQQRDVPWQPALDKYSDCNRHAVKGLAFQQGDPLSLALAASGMCARLERELKDVVQNAYRDVMNPTDIGDAIEKARRTMLERNAAEIVAARAAGASAPPPPKPPQARDY
jgi:hypothetical protein